MVTDAPIDGLTFCKVEEALKDFEQGKFLIVMDNEDRENEGDLIIAGAHATPEKIAFMIRYTSGYLCAPTTEERLEELNIPLMVPNTSDPLKTAYGISIDFKEGTTTGISAADRAKTCLKLADPTITDPTAFSRPGHILPLRAANNGVLQRQGHTEAAVGLFPCGVIGELVNDDGTMKRRDDCLKFGLQHGIKSITIADMIDYRTQLLK